MSSARSCFHSKRARVQPRDEPKIVPVRLSFTPDVAAQMRQRSSSQPTCARMLESKMRRSNQCSHWETCMCLLESPPQKTNFTRGFLNPLFFFFPHLALFPLHSSRPPSFPLLSPGPICTAGLLRIRAG